MDMQKYSFGHADTDIELHDLGLVGGNARFYCFERFSSFNAISLGF